MKFLSLSEFDEILNHCLLGNDLSYDLYLEDLCNIPDLNIFPFVEISSSELINCASNFLSFSPINIDIGLKLKKSKPEDEQHGAMTLFQNLAERDMHQAFVDISDDASNRYHIATYIHLIYNFGIVFGFGSDLTLLATYLDLDVLKKTFQLEALINYSIHNAFIIEVAPPILDIMKNLYEN